MTAPVDPYEWRESVLSTRSLSYMSNADFFASASRSASLSHPSQRPRRDTQTSDGSDLVMGNTHDDGPHNSDNPNPNSSSIPQLPSSVAGSFLFTLPREIRDRIYTFCLAADNGTPVEWPLAPGGKNLCSLQPQLLRTCKIIHDESAPLLYSLNHLVFHHPSDANMFVRALASPPLARRFTTVVSLHIKATDTRLWMPYLTSTDSKRSLRADFPQLREIHVRYRSNRWNHSVPPEQNIRGCVGEDGKLEELIDGLRNVFLPKPLPKPRRSKLGGVDPLDEDHAQEESGKPLNEMNEDEFMRFVDARRPGEDLAFKRQLLELHKAHAPAACRAPQPPTIRVLCVCRVNPAHFTSITAPSSASPQQGGNPVPNNTPGGPAAILAHALNAATAAAEISTPLIQPVKEGEPFRGFTPIDFQGTGKKLRDAELGSARTASTPYVSKDGVLVALQLHTLDPAARTAGGGH
ncbi:hypothetical protein KC360_g6747 [Hortaea werneckii]|nr:hypothetical protein KC325_g8360 [Hortaea werneckii]KAI6989395.1 hypothetical protein KC359_g7253 [Hortaea werneckii]KAI7140910.1 hypothetical protein KC344_g8375 [Hortaea werneckii]KAI7170523.1 hypothetical protein KC360_g6747 [Hortaea werneckii]